MPAGIYLEGEQSTAASVTDTNIELAAGSGSVLAIERVRVSQQTHKTSEQYNLQGQRITTTGTGTSTTPQNKEPSSAALGAARIGTCKTADSVEPTYTASTVFLKVAVNSLNGRDVVYPPGKEIYVAPSSIVGLAVITPAGTTTATYQVEVEASVYG